MEFDKDKKLKHIGCGTLFRKLKLILFLFTFFFVEDASSSQVF